jgi:peptidoglycan/xylan/chitin deacetylase (PgdA/CDA1 family)
MKKTLAYPVIICLSAVALLACTALAGCGERKVSRVPHLGATMKDMAGYIGSLVDDTVIAGRLVTFDQGDLAGKLPPVQPAAVIRRGNPNLKRVALTIDDGWNADMRILDLLKRWNIRFTAFLIGDRGVADAHPEFVRRIFDSGGEVCSHTWTHYIMRGKDQATVLNEIWRSEDTIAHVTHEVFPYIRFSGGSYDDASLNWAAEQGFWLVNWTIDTADSSRAPNTNAQVASVLANLKPGAIILCHFGGHNTYEVLARAIPEIQKRGYEVTSLTRVLEGTPYILKPAAER